jgi:hypothetical protein
MKITIWTSAEEGKYDENLDIEMDMLDIREFVEILKSIDSLNSHGNVLNFSTMTYDTNQHRFDINLNDGE